MARSSRAQRDSGPSVVGLLARLQSNLKCSLAAGVARIELDNLETQVATHGHRSGGFSYAIKGRERERERERVNQPIVIAVREEATSQEYRFLEDPRVVLPWWRQS